MTPFPYASLVDGAVAAMMATTLSGSASLPAPDAGFAPTIFPLFQGTCPQTAGVAFELLVMVTSSIGEAGHSQTRKLLK
jgi:hypothetical protein